MLRRGQKRKNFITYLPCFTYVPFVEVSLKTDDVMKILYLLVKDFSEVAVLLDSWVHAMFVHTHTHTCQKPLMLLFFFKESVEVHVLFCLLFSISLILQYPHAYSLPQSSKPWVGESSCATKLTFYFTFIF